MRVDEIRRRYLEFFVRRDHRLFASDSLVPEGDASVLFTGAGMNQFKDAFLGKGPPDLRRATSSQKCLRMPDLDNVGRTPSHHTFFEMLGNFSFGDYFKREAIRYAVEFLEGELGIPRSRLAVTVYLEDDEAATIWEQEIGFAKDRIFRYGESDNFWPAEAPSKGPNGPCGPCSEIYFDFGKAAAKTNGGGPAEDNGRYVEVWNLVFTQFDRRDGGVLAPLPRKNIDTGMGLERIARVMQGKATNYEIDSFAPILAAIQGAAGKRYGEDAPNDVRMRRIADHLRAATFCIADGVRPGNEGRGYVVRKVVRRAAMDLRELGAREPRLKHVVPAVVAAMGGHYEELRERGGLIADVIDFEETRFGEVYTLGTERLRGYLDELPASGARELPGEKAFFLWDTVGLPFDITKRFCEDQGVAVDEAGFEAKMDEQRERARAGSQMASDIFGTGPAAQLKGRIDETEFVGYAATTATARVVAILDEGGASVTAIHAGTGAATVILDRTPFYAESGGQVGDHGVIESVEPSAGAAKFEVDDTRKADRYHFHVGRVVAGSLEVGQRVTARIDADRRSDVMRNHTATHLLHFALRRVLGAETTQAGSLVHPEYLRFDYTAKSAPTAAQAREIEDLVNGKILKDLAVGKIERSFQEARQDGALALFGEKYGDRVRVVSVLDDDDDAAADARENSSVELCGGTHCDRTGQIGLFKIVSDAAIAAGVRRIVAVTGRGALAAVRGKFDLTRQLSDLLKTREDELTGRIEALLAERTRLEKDVAKAKAARALEAAAAIAASPLDVEGLAVMRAKVDGAGHDELRALADELLATRPNGVCLLVGLGDGASIVVAAGKEAVKRGVKSGDLCRQIAKALGGGGGGKPEMAQGQGRDLAALDPALDAAVAAIAAATRK
jgi:alanyl-tRNA synthetase